VLLGEGEGSATVQSIDATQLAAIQRLTYRDFATLAPSEIPYLTNSQVASIPDNWWFTRMSATARAAFTETQVPSLNVAKIGLAPLTAQQVGWLSEAQVASLGYQNFKYLLVGQIPRLTATQVASIPDNWWFTRMSAAARGAFTETQVPNLNVATIGLSPLTSQQIGWLSQAQVESLTYQNFQYLLPSQIPLLTATQGASIPDNWWFTRMNGTARAAFAQIQIPHLNVAKIGLAPLTAQQIGWLSQAQIESLTYQNFQYLLPSQIPLLTAAQVASIPDNWWFTRMNAAVRGAFTETQVPSLNVAKIGLAPLSTQQIGWLSQAQIASLTYQNFQYLLPSQIPLLTAAQVASIPDNWWFTRMNAAARGAFTETQAPSLNVAKIGLAPLSTQQIGWLSQAQIASLTYQNFQYLLPSQIPLLTAAQVASIPDNWWFTRMNAAVRGAFTETQVPSLNVAKIGLAPLTAQQIGWLSQTQIESLTYQNFQYLVPSQIPLLTAVQVASIPDNWWFTRMNAAARGAFTEAQVANLNVAKIGLAPLTTEQIGWLSQAQIESLTYQSFQYLAPSQIPLLTAAQIASIPDDWWFTRLSEDKRVVLTELQVQALNTAKVSIGNLIPRLRLALTIDQIRKLVGRDFRHLTRDQVQHLTEAQMASVTSSEDIRRMADDAETALSRVQLLSLRPKVAAGLMSMSSSLAHSEDPTSPTAPATGGDHGPHPDDPEKRDEHLAVFALVPHDAATHRTVASGSWSNPAIWNTQTVPGAHANVLVSAGTEVRFDSILVTPLHTVRVDGTLEFATHVDTQLLVDTIIVDPAGALHVGTAAQPVASGVAARIVIADTGPIDTAWDPRLLSRGLISHGELVMHGEEVTPYVGLAAVPLAGDRVLVLSEAPTNWRVGDRIVLTGVSPWRNEDEERAILAIDGNRITVAPLTYNHRTPAGHGLTTYVANMNRNVVVMSQNVAINNRRGHVMAMHSDHVHVDNVGLYGLGRTDKRNPINDPVLDKDGKLIDKTGLNPRGRYSFHVHRTGTSADGHPVEVSGSVVVDSPGWGFVNHDSYAVMKNNVAFHIVGAAFVSEIGNEIGAFRNNLAIRTTGSGDGIESRQDIFDFAHGGHGFWLQGPGVEVVGNIASGHTDGAIVFFTASSEAQFDAANLSDPSLAGGRTQVPVGTVPLKKVEDNIAFASRTGLETWFHLTHMNDGQTIIDGFTSWNTASNGVFTPYTGRTTLKDVTVIGNHSRPSGTGFGRNDVTNNMTYDNVTVDGFEVGISVPVNRATVINNGRFHAIRAIEIRGAQDTIRTVDINGDPEFSTLTKSQLQGKTQYDVYLSGEISLKNRDIETYFSPDIVRLGTVRFQDRQVYYHKQAANAIPFPSATSPSWLPPELLDKTNLEIWSQYGIAPGGIVAPADAVQVERINGLVGPRSVYQPELQLRSRKYTNQLDNYQLVYRTPGGDTIADPQRVNLREGWNLVTRQIDGKPRTFFVYGDITAPTFTLSSSTPLVVNPNGLEFGFVVRGTVFDDSFGTMSFAKKFEDLQTRPIQTRADGSQFIRLEFQIKDLAGNTTNVVLELNLDPNAPLVPGTGQKDLPPRELPVTLLELLQYYYLTGQTERLGDL